MNQLKLMTICAGLCVGLAGAGTAVAEEAPPTARVSFADLDLANHAGVARLDSRLRGAARQLCQPYTRASLREQTERMRCYSTALNGGRRQAAQQATAAGQTRFAARQAIIVSAR